jgi:hypothetical protein
MHLSSCRATPNIETPVTKKEPGSMATKDLKTTSPCILSRFSCSTTGLEGRDQDPTYQLEAKTEFSRNEMETVRLGLGLPGIVGTDIPIVAECCTAITLLGTELPRSCPQLKPILLAARYPQAFAPDIVFDVTISAARHFCFLIQKKLCWALRICLLRAN